MITKVYSQELTPRGPRATEGWGQPEKVAPCPSPLPLVALDPRAWFTTQQKLNVCHLLCLRRLRLLNYVLCYQNNVKDISVPRQVSAQYIITDPFFHFPQETQFKALTLALTCLAPEGGYAVKANARRWWNRGSVISAVCGKRKQNAILNLYILRLKLLSSSWQQDI
jgi:hypothetical protein